MIASGLAENGAKVYIVGRRRERLEQAVEAFKGLSQIFAALRHRRLKQAQAFLVLRQKKSPVVAP